MNGSVKGSRATGWSFIFDPPRVNGKRRQVHRRGFKTKSEAEQAMRDAMAAVSGAERWSRLIAADTWSVPCRHMAAVDRQPGSTHDVRHLSTTCRQAHCTQDRWRRTARAVTNRWSNDGSPRAGPLSGLSAKSVRNVHAVLSKALADALRLRMVSRNAGHLLPCFRRSCRSKSPGRGLPTISAGFSPMWKATGGSPCGDCWRRPVCAAAKCLGCAGQDVDLSAGTVTINKKRAVAGGSVVQGPPKTASGARTIAVDPTTLAALKAWRKVQVAEQLAMGAGWVDTGGLVFVWPDGSPPWPAAVTSRFKAHAVALGLPTIGVHGLRHTAATWMIASGESPKMVAQRLWSQPCRCHVGVVLARHASARPGSCRPFGRGT